MNDVRLAGKVKAAGAFDRKLLLSGLTTSRKDATLPIAAFDAAMRLVPGFAVNMPPERILQFATEVLAEWEFLEEGSRGYDVTEDGKIAAASWLPKSLVHRLRERVLAARNDVKVSAAIVWALEDIPSFDDVSALVPYAGRLCSREILIVESWCWSPHDI